MDTEVVVRMLAGQFPRSVFDPEQARDRGTVATMSAGGVQEGSSLYLAVQIYGRLSTQIYRTTALGDWCLLYTSARAPLSR